MAKAKKLSKKKGAEKKKKQKKSVRKTKSVPRASPKAELDIKLPKPLLKRGDPSTQIGVKKRRVSEAEKANRLKNFRIALEKICEYPEALEGLPSLATRSEVAINCVRIIEWLGHNVSIERPNI